MAAGQYNFTIEQGAVFSRVITLVGRDLTGYEARMHIRERVSAPTVLIELTSDGADGRLSIAPGTDSVITMTIDAIDTAALSFGSGRYDLKLIPPAGEGSAERLLEGDVVLTPGVTR